MPEWLTTHPSYLLDVARRPNVPAPRRRLPLSRGGETSFGARQDEGLGGADLPSFLFLGHDLPLQLRLARRTALPPAR